MIERLGLEKQVRDPMFPDCQAVFHRHGKPTQFPESLGYGLQGSGPRRAAIPRSTADGGTEHRACRHSRENRDGDIRSQDPECVRPLQHRERP